MPDRGNHRLCFLNISPYEVIRSLFYNKANNSIITVSVYKQDNFSSLNCRSTPLECAPPRSALHCVPAPD